MSRCRSAAVTGAATIAFLFAGTAFILRNHHLIGIITWQDDNLPTTEIRKPFQRQLKVYNNTFFLIFPNHIQLMLILFVQKYLYEVKIQ